MTEGGDRQMYNDTVHNCLSDNFRILCSLSVTRCISVRGQALTTTASTICCGCVHTYCHMTGSGEVKDRNISKERHMRRFVSGVT